MCHAAVRILELGVEARTTTGRLSTRMWRAVFLAAGVLVALSFVLVGANASHAGVQGRTGMIAFIRSVADGPSSLFVIKPDGSGLRRFTPSGSDIGLFEWAPDGSRIAYLDRRGALWLVRPDGTGRVLLAPRSPLRSPWSLSWSPDGKATVA